MSVAPSDDPRVAFIKATFALAKHNPAGWADFLIAFDNYTIEALEEAVKSPVDKVHLSVGAARRMVLLRDEFHATEQLMARISGNR